MVSTAYRAAIMPTSVRNLVGLRVQIPPFPAVQYNKWSAAATTDIPRLFLHVVRGFVYNKGMKKLGDYHVHSGISPDSEESMENAAAAALACGLGEIVFTDHYDEDYPYDGFPPPDWPAYFQCLSAVREKFPELKIRAGVELGMHRASNGKIRRTLAPWQFDFILFSKHVAGGRDPWFEDFYADRPQRDAERVYLEEMLEDIRAWDDFDVVGHIGYADKYLTRYSSLPSPGTPFEYADFPEEIDAIFRELISRGKGIELNTSTFPEWGQGMPRISLLKRYAELGGEILTFGSDAHSAGRVGEGFGLAAQMAREAGLRWVCIYEERKPQFHSLQRIES